MNALVYLPTFELNKDASGAHLPGHKSSPVLLLRRDRRQVPVPYGLLVTGDDSIRRTLGETLLLCGAVPVLATTIEHAAHHVRSGNLRFGICQDRLPDGKYEDLLLLSHAAGNSFPWIVISRTGDWPDYLAATELGAYDFLAYPLIYGELTRIIRRLLQRDTRKLIEVE